MARGHFHVSGVFKIAKLLIQLDTRFLSTYLVVGRGRTAFFVRVDADMRDVRGLVGATAVLPVWVHGLGEVERAGSIPVWARSLHFAELEVIIISPMGGLLARMTVIYVAMRISLDDLLRVVHLLGCLGLRLLRRHVASRALLVRVVI